MHYPSTKLHNRSEIQKCSRKNDCGLMRYAHGFWAKLQIPEITVRNDSHNTTPSEMEEPLGRHTKIVTHILYYKYEHHSLQR